MVTAALQLLGSASCNCFKFPFLIGSLDFLPAFSVKLRLATVACFRAKINGHVRDHTCFPEQFAHYL